MVAECIVDGSRSNSEYSKELNVPWYSEMGRIIQANWMSDRDFREGFNALWSVRPADLFSESLIQQGRLGPSPVWHHTQWAVK